MRADVWPSSLLLLAVGRALAQGDEPPPIGTIDFYGLRTISESVARDKLPFSRGDSVARFSAEAVSAEMTRALGVARVELAGICCTEGARALLRP